jgi:hypothetical protein
VGAQLGHDLRGQVPPRASGDRLVGHVLTVDGEVLTEPGRDLARAGEPHGPDPLQHGSHFPGCPDAGVCTDAPGGDKVGEAVQERLHVHPPESARTLACVGAEPQGLRKHRHAVHVVAHRQAAARAAPRPDAAPRKVVGGPPLGRLPQPALADLPERNRPVVAEDGEIPVVSGDLALGGGERPAGVGGKRARQPDVAEVPPPRRRDHEGFNRGDLLAAQVVAERPQIGLFGLDSFEETAALEAVEDLGDHEGLESPQADLPADADGRLGRSPAHLVEVRLAPSCDSQAELMGLAVAAVGVAPLTRNRPARHTVRSTQAARRRDG